MLHIACLLWEPNRHSHPFSRRYDEEWVNRLYRGFKRNLSYPFRFICFTDKERVFAHSEIEQMQLKSKEPSYSDCIQPYDLGEPMILCGLDTVVVGNCDLLADYCRFGDKIALPLDPFNDKQVCNGVALVPKGHRYIYEMWSGENDMLWLRKMPHVVLDNIFPGKIVSYKGHVKKYGLTGVKVVFFHGNEKPDEIEEEWVKQNWA